MTSDFLGTNHSLRNFVREWRYVNCKFYAVGAQNARELPMRSGPPWGPRRGPVLNLAPNRPPDSSCQH